MPQSTQLPHTATAFSQPYRVELTSGLQSGQTLLSLWGQSGLDISLGKYNWYYRNNPLITPAVLLLRTQDRNEVVGTCSLGFRQMMFGHQAVLGANRCDLTVVPSHRGTLAAPTLLQGVHEEGLKQADLIYGLPNSFAQGVVSRSGFKQIGKLYTYSKVLDLDSYVRNKVPQRYRKLTSGWLPLIGAIWREWQDKPRASEPTLRCALVCIDSRFDDLWRRYAHYNWLIGVRDQAFLSWRFDPAFHPHIEVIGLVDQHNELHGYAAVSHQNGHTQVHDFLARPDAQMSGLQRLFKGVFEHAHAKGSSTVHVQFFGSDAVTQTFKSMGMRRRGGHPIFAAGRITEEVFGNQFYMTWADTDV